MFAVVDVVLLQPLPWPDPDRLVVIHAVHPQRRHNPATAATWNRGWLSWPAWDALKTTRAFESIAVWRPVSQTFGEQRSDVVPTLHISSSYLPTLGAALLYGRNFTPEEDETISDSVILTHESWHRRFGARPDVVGQPVTLGYDSSGEQRRHKVVGVLEPTFRIYGGSPEFLLPIGYSAWSGRTYQPGVFRALARLANGMTVDGTHAIGESALRNTELREPTSLRLVPLQEEYLGGAQRPLWLLLGAASALLLVACSSIAGLMIGDGRARRHEISVRRAVGGATGRIFRQLLVEHALLAAIGAIAGLVFGIWLTRIFVGIAPEGLPRLELVSMNVRIASLARRSRLLHARVLWLHPRALARSNTCRRCPP